MAPLEAASSLRHRGKATRRRNSTLAAAMLRRLDRPLLLLRRGLRLVLPEELAGRLRAQHVPAALLLDDHRSAPTPQRADGLRGEEVGTDRLDAEEMNGLVVVGAVADAEVASHDEQEVAAAEREDAAATDHRGAIDAAEEPLQPV